jgi:8-oxo-dGTP pyrophosphatase MutT (NUDIX family)
MPKVAVIAVRHPTDSDLFLHGLRKDTGQWNLIGGHFKAGEAPDEAARREMKEEAGLDLPIDFAMDKHFGDHHVHLFYATPNGELNLDTSNDPDAEFLTFKWLNPTYHRNLHVPASRNILVDHMKQSELQKGAAQRLFPFNPREDVNYDENEVTQKWTEGRGNQYRDQIGENHPNARSRALLKLHARTQVRKNPKSGEKEFLLHRGMNSMEHDSILSAGGTSDKTSWTPDLKIAQSFADDYSDTDPEMIADYEKEYGKKLSPNFPKVVSAWIPEKQIHNFPVYNLRNASDVATNEQEIIVHPHSLNFHTPPPLKIVKSIELDQSLFIDELEKNAPLHLDQIHPNGDKIAKMHPNGKLMWHSSKKIADNHDRILTSPEMTQNFLKTVPESHRGLMAGLINHVAKDPNRHFIPTEENGTQKLRARHIKDLIYGGGDVKLDTSNPDILKITRNSHSQGINSGAKIAFNFKRSGLGKSETNDGRTAAGTMRTVWDGIRFVSSLHTERSEVHLEKGRGQDFQRNDSNHGTEGLEKADRLKLKVEPFTAHPDHFDPKKHDFVVHLHRGDEKLGFMAVTHKKEGIMPFQFEVSEEHKRKGHGTRLAAYAQILSNKKILTTPDQSPAYNKFKTSFDSKNKFKPKKT